MFKASACILRASQRRFVLAPANFSALNQQAKKFTSVLATANFSALNQQAKKFNSVLASKRFFSEKTSHEKNVIYDKYYFEPTEEELSSDSHLRLLFDSRCSNALECSKRFRYEELHAIASVALGFTGLAFDQILLIAISILYYRRQCFWRADSVWMLKMSNRQLWTNTGLRRGYKIDEIEKIIEKIKEREKTNSFLHKTYRE